MEPNYLRQVVHALLMADGLDDAVQQRLIQLISGRHWQETVDALLKLARTGRVAKRRSLNAALALCTTCATGDRVVDVKVRQAVYGALSEVFQIPTDLFQLLFYEAQFSKSRHRVRFGRCKRAAIAKWYNSITPEKLAYLITKYRQRCGWSHQDLLRVAHVKPASDGAAMVLKYITKGLESARAFTEEGGDEMKRVFNYLQAVETVKHSHDEQEIIKLIEEYKLVHEHVPTWFMKSKEVWRALLPHMPILALIKNLSRLGSLGLLDSLSTDSSVELVVERLTDEQHLRDARVHPVNILLAMKTYEKGLITEGKKQKRLWNANKSIVDALETAFYKSFQTIDSSGKRYVLAIDVSESMSYGGVAGCSYVSPSVASAAMALILARREQSSQVVGLSNIVQELSVSSSSLLADVCSQLSKFVSKDVRANCAKLMLWAADEKREVDVFVIFTDQRGGGTNSSEDEVTKTFNHYRQVMNRPNARLVIVSLTTAESTMADSTDSHIIHLAGFDSTTPEIIRMFALGELDCAIAV